MAITIQRLPTVYNVNISSTAITYQSLYTVYNVNFYGNIIKTTVPDHPAVIDRWIADLDNYRQEVPHNVIVGIEIMWCHPFNRPAILQLCVGFHCIIIQLVANQAFQPQLPESLVDFLNSEFYDFVGFNNERYMQSLGTLYGLHIRNYFNLGYIAAFRYRERYVGLERLARRVMNIDIEIPWAVRMSNWEDFWLSEEQIKLACVVAYVSFEIGNVCFNVHLGFDLV